MAQRDWGTGIGLHFLSDQEYYEVLGYLTRGHGIRIYTHQNQRSGAWGYQGKLEYTTLSPNMPNSLHAAFSASGDHRLSVSPYVENLRHNHSFHISSTTDYTADIYPVSYAAVRSTVPAAHYTDFDRGYNM